MASMAACECGTKEQTADQIITSCPIYHHPNGVRALTCEKEPGDLADGNMSSHLVDHSTPVHLLQTKKMKKITITT